MAKFIGNSDAKAPGSLSDTDYIIKSKVSISDVVGARLYSFIMPNTMYNVSSTNNVLNFTIADDVDGTNAVDYEVSLTPMFYSNSSIASALKSAIDTAISPIVSTVSLPQDTTVTSIAVDSGKYIKINPTFSIDPLPDPLPASLNLLLGFSRTSSTDYGTIVYSPNSYDLQRYKVLNLYCDQIAQDGWSSVGKSQKGILATIPVTVGPGEIISFVPPAGGLFTPIAAGNLSTIHLYVLDSEGYQIDNRGKLTAITLDILVSDSVPGVSRR